MYRADSCSSRLLVVHDPRASNWLVAATVLVVLIGGPIVFKQLNTRILVTRDSYRYHHEVPITAGQSECKEHLPGLPAGPGFEGRPGQTVEAWLLKYECQANTTPSARAKRPMISSTSRPIRRSVM
jgi:hypothetical protein